MSDMSDLSGLSGLGFRFAYALRARAVVWRLITKKSHERNERLDSDRGICGHNKYWQLWCNSQCLCGFERVLDWSRGG